MLVTSPGTPPSQPVESDMATSKSKQINAKKKRSTKKRSIKANRRVPRVLGTEGPSNSSVAIKNFGQPAISFTLKPADGEPNFHRAAQLEDGTWLTFNEDEATASVNIGAHTLRWWAAGNVQEQFSFELKGNIKKGSKESGTIPIGKITGGMIDFEAVAS
jgi:hypothetical protein